MNLGAMLICVVFLIPQRANSGMVLDLGNGTLARSPLCVAPDVFANEKVLQLNLTDQNYLRVDGDACSWRSTPNASALAAKYTNSFLDFRSFEQACFPGFTSASLAFRRKEFDAFANFVNAKGTLQMREEPSDRFVVPGRLALASSSLNIGNGVPSIECQYAEPFDTFFVAAHFAEFSTISILSITGDANEWLAVYGSTYYEALVYACSVLYLSSAVLALGFLFQLLRERRTQAKVTRAVLLALESVAQLIMGTHLFVGVWYSSVTYPFELHNSLFTLLTGISLATSLLAGITFEDAYTQAKNLRVNHKSIWLRKGGRLTAVICTCISLDVIAIASSTLFLQDIEVVLGRVFAIATLIVATTFISKSFSFVFGTLSLMSEHSISRYQKRIYHLAKLLFMSGIAMFVNAVLFLLIGLSGSALFGIFSPGSWVPLSLLFLVSRWVYSLAQVLLCRPYYGPKAKQRPPRQPVSTTVYINQI